MTRNRIFGAIGVLWGGGILLARLFRSGGEAVAADPGFAAGQTMALVLGALMAVAGLYYLIKG